MKFGKLAPKPHPSTLQLSKYLPRLVQDPEFGVSLPIPPPKVYYEFRVPEGQWNDYSNTSVGDCTVASIAHLAMNTSVHTGPIFVPPLRDVLAFYSAVSGYVPGDSSTDNGAAITDVLARWQGAGLSGKKILGWAAIDATNIPAVKQGIYIFGGVDIGFQVPQSAIEQTDAMMAWDVMQTDSNIVGGHSVCLLGFGNRGATCVTWGRLQRMTWEFFAKYCDEAYCCVDQAWVNTASGRTLSGFDLNTLLADLKALGVLPAKFE